MIYSAQDFKFNPPRKVAFARRILIKPDASVVAAHPATTSRETLAAVIAGIRRHSDADIIFLEGPSVSERAHEVFKQLGYDFPRVIAVDVRDCSYVEVENLLPKPFVLQSIWVPNVVLSCDFLISVSSFRVVDEATCGFTLKNMLGLLPAAKYGPGLSLLREKFHRLDLHGLIADLYFTLPCDLGIIDSRLRQVGGRVEPFGRVFVGDPAEVDARAAQLAGVRARYLDLIEMGRSMLLQRDSIENVEAPSAND